jgi:hypothetical protein
MFATSGIELPAAVRKKTPADVGRCVAKTIESNPAEAFVAPIELRLAATLGSLAPGISSMIQRRAGTAEMKDTRSNS